MRVTLTLGWFTFRDLARQGTTLAVLFAVAAWIAFTQFLPMFLGDEESELRLVTDIGLASILLGGLAVALLPAASALSDETDARTAVTLLSKPVTRRAFFQGKFLGILETLLLCVSVWGLVLLWTVQHKAAAIRSVWEEAPPPPFWNSDVAQGAALMGAQAALAAAAALALSNALPTTVNLAASVALVAAGYLSGPLARSAGIPPGGAADAARGLFPDFQLFNLSDAIAAGTPIPPAYTAWTLAYATALSAAILAAGTWWFARRDI